MRRGTSFTILVILYAVMPLGLTALYFFGTLYEAVELIHPYNISIFAGAAAYMVFMSQFLIAARLRWLERWIPQDRLLAIHGLSGLTAVGLLVIHFVIKYIMIVGPGGVTFQSALGLLAFLIALILAPLALFVLRRRRPGAAGNPRYEGNKTAHNIFAAAGLAALIHVMMATSTWSIALKTVVLVWGLFALGAYVWHKILRPRRAAVLNLASVDELAPGVHAYALEPADGAKLRPRRSGQFAYLRFLGSPSGPEEHPFTVASPADAAPRFVVRGSGDYTRTLPETPTGTEVRLEGPYGHFHPGDEPEGTPLMFLAGGIGITPFLSMTGDAELRRRYPMNLLWSIHDEQDAGAGDALERAVAAGELKMRTVVSGREGRVGLEDLQAMMDEAGLEDAASGLWFVCGPAGFTDGMTRLLRGMKVPRRRLVEERFSW